MKVNPISNKLTYKQNFGVKVDKSILDAIFVDDLAQKMSVSKSVKERNIVLNIAEKVYKKASEMLNWDNNNTRIGLDSSSDLIFDIPRLGIQEHLCFKKTQEKISVTDMFLSLKFEDYMAKKSPIVKSMAKKNAEADNPFVANELIDALGIDSFKVYKAEYNNHIHKKELDFTQQVKKILGLEDV